MTTTNTDRLTSLESLLTPRFRNLLITLWIAFSLLAPSASRAELTRTDLENLAQDSTVELGAVIAGIAAKAAATGEAGWWGALTREERQTLVGAVNLAIARQLQCMERGRLARSEVEGLQKETDSAYLRRLLEDPQPLFDAIAGEEIDILLLLKEAHPTEVQGSRGGSPRGLIVLRNQVLLRNWGATDQFPAGDQLPRGGGVGWPGLQRALVHELAHAAGFPVKGKHLLNANDWQIMERYLWKLWQTCEPHAEFGQAHPDRYPTRLFSPGSIAAMETAMQKRDLGARPALFLSEEEREKLGAHHFFEDLEWLGEEVDLELDGGVDQADDGVVGQILESETLEVTVSVSNPQSDRYGRNGCLIFQGWVDWTNNGQWSGSALADDDDHLKWSEVQGVGVRKKSLHQIAIHPDQWNGAKRQTYELTFTGPSEVEREKYAVGPDGWARFRLHYENGCGSVELKESGATRYGEVEDYMIKGKRGKLVRAFDLRLDATLHFAGRPVDAPGWVDIHRAGIRTPSDHPTLWDDFSVPLPGEDYEPASRPLDLEMELYEPVPEAPDAPFASWHFILDLDGERSTGHPGAERPVGVFPSLGVDAWVDLIWDGVEGAFFPVLFLGPEGIGNLIPAPTPIPVAFTPDRTRVAFELPLDVLEEELSALYGDPFEIHVDRIEWVAVTNYAATEADFEDPPSDFFPDHHYLPEGSCARRAGDGTALCLNDGRFLVEADWATTRGTSGPGRGMPLTGDTGTFWFFDPANVELLVKVIDACGEPFDRFWVFAGGLTNVRVDLTVTDTFTGEVRRYANRQGSAFEPILDTDAFDTCGGEDGTSAPSNATAGSTTRRAVAEALGDPALLLSESRFRVEVAWATKQGTSGTGQAVPMTGDTGHFWFFDPANVELVVKVLDACSFTDRFWVFAGGLTNVEVEITVTDTETGAVRTYRNPQGQAFQPILDTGAFATCG